MCSVNDSSSTVTVHSADRLLQAIDRRAAPVCVGLDPVYERLPKAVRSVVDLPEARIESIDRFTVEVLDAIAGGVDLFDADAPAKPTETSDERKADQKALDAGLLKAVDKTPMLKAYLAALFTLTKGMKPHEMKF